MERANTGCFDKDEEVIAGCQKWWQFIKFVPNIMVLSSFTLDNVVYEQTIQASRHHRLIS
jgi:hypothetical protein